MPEELDEFDKKLLEQVQRNNRLTAQELGEIVGLSASAVQRRLARLREGRVIEADVSIVSPAVLGVGLVCIVDVILQEGHARILEKFKADMQACPLVRQCYYVTGTIDFVLVVHARDMAHYEDFTRTWLMDKHPLKHFYTHVVMDRVKVN
jgi:Lrp/AsnC family transcriptional regulator, leucine-responsive regulatory protein